MDIRKISVEEIIINFAKYNKNKSEKVRVHETLSLHSQIS